MPLEPSKEGSGSRSPSAAFNFLYTRTQSPPKTSSLEVVVVDYLLKLVARYVLVAYGHPRQTLRILNLIVYLNQGHHYSVDISDGVFDYCGVLFPFPLRYCAPCTPVLYGEASARSYPRFLRGKTLDYKVVFIALVSVAALLSNEVTEATSNYQNDDSYDAVTRDSRQIDERGRQRICVSLILIYLSKLVHPDLNSTRCRRY
nr:hypothetical protein HmN_000948900 [Hymenolepis microstoma]